MKENEDVTFTIKFKGTPEPDVEWSTKQTVLKKSPRIKTTKDEQSAALTIKRVGDEYVGEYTVKVKNDIGDAEAKLTLIIISKFT